MATPQPQRRPASASPAVRRAKNQPTNQNLADAIYATYQEFGADIQILKEDVGVLKGDVCKLLHHFGLTSGSAP